MSDRLVLVGGLLAVFVIAGLQDPALLAVLLALVLALAGREAPMLLRGVLPAVAWINLAVSAGYAVPAWLDARPWLEFVLRLNLRVVLLGVLTLWLAGHVRLERAVAGWPSLTFLVVVVQGQFRALRATWGACRQGLASRMPERLAGMRRIIIPARQLAVLIDKAEAGAEELTRGMRARGAFDDRV